MPRSFTEDQNSLCSYKRTEVQNEMFRKSQSSSTQGNRIETNGPRTVLSHPYMTVSWHRVHNCGINVSTSYPALSRQDGDFRVPPCPHTNAVPLGWAGSLSAPRVGPRLGGRPCTDPRPHTDRGHHGASLQPENLTEQHVDSFGNNLFSHVLLKEKCSAQALGVPHLFNNFSTTSLFASL